MFSIFTSHLVWRDHFLDCLPPPHFFGTCLWELLLTSCLTPKTHPQPISAGHMPHDLLGSCTDVCSWSIWFSFDFSGLDLMIYFTILKGIISLKGQYLSIFITNVVTPQLRLLISMSGYLWWPEISLENKKKYNMLNNKCLPIFIGLKEFMSKLQW